MRKLIGIIASAILLAACAKDLPGSVAGGECQVFTPPDAVICGQTSTDQAYIDEQIERGVQGCGWKRAPAGFCQALLDAKPAPKKRTLTDKLLRRNKPVQ